jgi:hypothetical protein
MIFRTQLTVDEYTNITEPNPQDDGLGIHLKRRIRDEVYDWMDEYQAWHEHRDNIYGYRTSWMTFRNKDEWMLFKLTWL